eukprot:14324570-Alexandrium_andersonii.AAC.1
MPVATPTPRADDVAARNRGATALLPTADDALDPESSGELRRAPESSGELRRPVRSRRSADARAAHTR